MKPIFASMLVTVGMMVADSVIATEMPALAKKHNCTACHAVEKTVIGPAWINISMKYKGVDKFEYFGKEYPIQEGLVLKASKGGSGHWGSMPMPANDLAGNKQEDIKTLVQFILGLAK